MAYQMRFLPPLQALMGMYANLATVRVSLRRVSQILDEPIEVQEAVAALSLPAVRGDVEFDDVALSFGPGGPVVDRLSVAVRAGGVVADVSHLRRGKAKISGVV